MVRAKQPEERRKSVLHCILQRLAKRHLSRTHPSQRRQFVWGVQIRWQNAMPVEKLQFRVTESQSGNMYLKAKFLSLINSSNLNDLCISTPLPWSSMCITWNQGLHDLSSKCILLQISNSSIPLSLFHYVGLNFLRNLLSAFLLSVHLTIHSPSLQCIQGLKCYFYSPQNLRKKNVVNCCNLFSGFEINPIT